jgi:hypothetical protein
VSELRGRLQRLLDEHQRREEGQYCTSAAVSPTTLNGHQGFRYTCDDVIQPRFTKGYGVFYSESYAISVRGLAVYVEVSVVGFWARDPNVPQLVRLKRDAAEIVRGLRFAAAGGSPATPVPTDDSGIPWQVIFGGGGLAISGGVLATAIVNIFKKRDKSKSKTGKSDEQEQDPDEVVGYILQLSSDAVMLTSGQPASVNATVWQVTANGATAQASDAAIQVDMPGAAASFLQVTPTSGQGQIACTFSQAGEPGQDEVLVTFNASAAQGGTSAQVRVTMAVILTAEVAQGQPVIRYFQPEKRWVVVDMVVYFRTPGDNTPVRVPFKYGFPDPNALFTADPPDILEQEQAYSPDEGLTWRVKMKLIDGVDLESKFGKRLTDHEGKIEVKVTVIREDQKTYTAEITYQLRPQVTMVAYSYDRDDTQDSGGHTYNDEYYDEMEFVADGVDKLPLALCFIRTDKEVKKDLEFLEAEDVVEIEEISWKAAEDISDFNQPEVNEAQSDKGIFAYDLGPAYGLKATKERIDRHHGLFVKAKLKSGGPKNYELERTDYEMSIKPQFLKLQLWVAPGEMRHTSEAYAYLNLLPSGKPLPKQSLMLTIENPAASSLSLDKCSAVQFTRPEEGYLDRGARLVRGSANWSLRYNGLSWNNLSQAIYRVSCELAGKDGTTALVASETININENVSKMLNDLLTDPKITAKLNNPFFKDSRLPGFCRGPIWNIGKLFDTSKPFLCFRMREDIISWLEKRRLYDKNTDVKTEMTMMRSMNGIEFEYYAMRPAHVWAGFFLSGTDRYSDYKALDPWWDQKWEDPSYASPDGLMDRWGEKAMAAKNAAALGLMAIALVGLLALGGVEVSIFGALAALKAWVIGTWPAEVIAAFGVDVAGGVAVANELSFTSESDYAKENGMLPLYDSNWFVQFIRQINPAGSGKEVGA